MTVVRSSRIERYDSSVRRNSKNLGSRPWASFNTRVASASALPRMRRASASASARIVSRVRSAWLVMVMYWASPSAREFRGDLLALAANQVEDGRPDFHGVVEPPQPDVQDLDAQLVPRGHATAATTSRVIASSAQ